MKYQLSFCRHKNMISSHEKITLHVIFTREISLLLWLHNKSRLSQQTTISVKWFGFCVEKNQYFTCLLHSLVKYLDFQHLKRNLYYDLCAAIVWSRRNINNLFWNKQVKAATLLIHKQLSSSVSNSILLHQIFKIRPNERTSRWPECGYGHLMGVAT